MIDRTVYRCCLKQCSAILISRPEYMIICGVVHRFCSHEHGEDFRSAHQALVTRPDVVRRITLEKVNRDGA